MSSSYFSVFPSDRQGEVPQRRRQGCDPGHCRTPGLTRRGLLPAYRPLAGGRYCYADKLMGDADLYRNGHSNHPAPRGGQDQNPARTRSADAADLPPLRQRRATAVCGVLRENGGEITISIFGKVTFVGDDDILYDDAGAFLDCIREELPYRDTTGFRYEVLTDDPAVRKAADDILFDFLGEENPCELEDYTQTMGGI